MSTTRNSRRRERRTSQCGATTVESALVIITFIGVITFVMDMGRILLIEQYVTERARTTARLAAVNLWDQTTVANVVAYNSTSPPGGGTSTPGILGVLPSQVTYSTSGIPGDSAFCVKVRVSGISAFVFVPYMAKQYVLPPIQVSAPSQSRGAVN